MQEKEAKIEAKRQELSSKKQNTAKTRLAAESKINEARIKAQQARKAAAAAETTQESEAAPAEGTPAEA